MSDTAVCDGEALAAQAALARVLLDFGKAPGRYSLRLGEPAALHAQLDTLALWALGRIPEPLQAQAAALQEAAVLFVQRLCFAPDNTHYQVLALAPQHLNPEALRARYRTLIRLTHPDMGVRGLPQNAAGLVNRAHEVLGSAVLRSTYDQQLAQAAARLRTPPPAPLQAGRSPGAPPAGARGRTGQNVHTVPATAPWLHKGPRRAMAEQWQALNARFPALLRFGAVAGSTGLLVAGVLAWAAMDAQKSGGLVVSSDPQANTAAAAAVSGAAAAAATTTATATATATAIPMANPAPASAQKTGPLVPPKAVTGLSASVTPSPVQAPTPAPAFVRLQAAVAPEAPAPAAPADPALLRRAEPKAMATPATPAAPVAAPAAPLAVQAAPPAKPQPQPQPQPQLQPQPPSLAATAAAASGRVAVPQDAAPRLAQAVKALPAPVPAPAPIPAPISAPASVAVVAVSTPVSAPTAAPAPGAVAAPAAAVAAPAAAPMTAPAVSVAAVPAPVPAPSAAKAVVDPAQARSYLVDLLRALERPSDAQRAQAFLGRMNVQGSLLAAPLQLARQSAAVQVTGIALSPVRPDAAAAGAAESSLALGGTLELQTSGGSVGSSSNADAASAAAPQGRKARYQVQAHFIATAQGAALARLDLREVE